MVLPVLGGAPAVWNTALMFFQGMLLLGYLYAHIMTRQFDFRTQSVIDTGVLADCTVYRFNRTAVLRRIEYRATDAEMVFLYRPSPRR